MRIRPATEADAEAVTEVVRAASVDAWADFLGEERINTALGAARHPAGLVAEDDDGVFGMVAWDGSTGEVQRMYVHPRGQRSGAAGVLLTHACDALRAAGCTRAWLYTEERNASAVAFYTRQGWRVEGAPRVRDWHGVQLVEPTFVKPL